MSNDPETAKPRFNEDAINQRRFDTVDALLAEGLIDHIPLPGQGPDREGTKQALGLVFGTLAEGEIVAQVVRIAGTNQEATKGMPATGWQMSMLGADRLRLRDGQVVECWGSDDQGSMTAQLGLQPPR